MQCNQVTWPVMQKSGINRVIYLQISHKWINRRATLGRSLSLLPLLLRGSIRSADNAARGGYHSIATYNDPRRVTKDLIFD